MENDAIKTDQKARDEKPLSPDELERRERNEQLKKSETVDKPIVGSPQEAVVSQTKREDFLKAMGTCTIEGAEHCRKICPRKAELWEGWSKKYSNGKDIISAEAKLQNPAYWPDFERDRATWMMRQDSMCTLCIAQLLLKARSGK